MKIHDHSIELALTEAVKIDRRHDADAERMQQVVWLRHWHSDTTLLQIFATLRRADGSKSETYLAAGAYLGREDLKKLRDACDALLKEK